MTVSGDHLTWRDISVTEKQTLQYYGLDYNTCLCFLASCSCPRKKEQVSLRSEISSEVISADPIFKIYPASYDHDKKSISILWCSYCVEPTSGLSEDREVMVSELGKNDEVLSNGL